MPLAKRIIPCLDVKDGATVKGVCFGNLKIMGDPVEMAEYYAAQGADELVFLDIHAGKEHRKTQTEWVSRVAKKINIPFTVGGGVNNTGDVRRLLDAGADKISVNTGAVLHPQLLEQIAASYGSQSLVVAMDVKKTGNDWIVFINAGQTSTGIKAEDWATQAEKSGAGEILLTSISNDGTKKGFATDITRRINNLVKIPVTASGGAGTEEDFLHVFLETGCSGALAAGIFHDNTLKIPELKTFLKNNNLIIR